MKLHRNKGFGAGRFALEREKEGWGNGGVWQKEKR